MTDWSQYVGLPHRAHGRDRDGLDCWGLVRLVYAEQMGVDLPGYIDTCPDLGERAELSAFVSDVRGGGMWQEVDEIRPFDVLLFRVGPHTTHVAVAIGPNQMLHVNGRSHSVIERIDAPMWRKRLDGVCRYQAQRGRVGVVEARGFLPDQNRRRFDVAPTVTIAEIVAHLVPGASEEALDRVRVTMTSGKEWAVVPRRWWPHVRPHGGTTVAVRIVPGDPGSIAGILAAQFVNLTGITSLAASQAAYVAAYGLASLGISALAGAVLTALIPPPNIPDGPGTPENRYRLQGWKNQPTPGEPVPLPVGRIRTAPVYAAMPYQEVVGDDQYIRALFCFGYGRLDISDLKIGDTSITEYADVTYDLREGLATDDPVTLTPIQVFEDQEQVELLYELPVDAEGNPYGDTFEEQNHVRTSVKNATRAGLIFSFPRGLSYTNNDGDTSRNNVDIRIRHRLVGSETWTTVTTLVVSKKTFDPFFRQYTWDFPTRGEWEVEVTRVSRSGLSTAHVITAYLSVFQSYRPEYPINLDAMSAPLALCSIRIRASHQLNGMLDSLNAVVQRYVPDWNGSAWVEGLTRNPASLFAYVLQAPDNPRPRDDTEIDWDVLAEWHEFCADKGLTYDYDHRSAMGLGDRLRAIAGAGRASPWHDGAKWSVVIDRPQVAEVDHIGPRNSRNLRGQRTYVDTPDAVRVRFLDEDNGYAEAEVIVPWPGKAEPYDLIEQWEKPGKTNGEEIAREVYRDMQVVQLRRDRWTVEQDGSLRWATRGDWVRLSHYVLSDTQMSGRVLSATGNLIILDELMTMEAGEVYALRFLEYDDADPVGQSVLTTVQTVPGETRTLRITGDATPTEGALVLFGVATEESFQALVLDVEPGQDATATLTLTNAAPEIDTLTDAYVPTDWDPIVGSVVDVGVDPVAPVFAGIVTTAAEGVYGADARTLSVSVTSATTEVALIAGFEIDHRLTGAGSWTTVSLTGGHVTADLSYDDGDEVETRARAIDFDGDAGAYTSTSTFTVGSDLGALPAAPDLASITVTGGLCHAAILLGHSDPNTTAIQIFRTAAGDTFDAATDVLGDPVNVASGVVVAFTDGDSTRGNALTGATWTAGGNWTGSGVPFSHSAGVESTLETPVAFTDGQTYRGEITVENRTAGSVTVRLTGDGDVATTAAITANGQTLIDLTATADHDTFEIVASTDFDGDVTSVQVTRETLASAPQGAFDYRFAALNSDGVGSAVSSETESIII